MNKGNRTESLESLPLRNSLFRLLIFAFIWSLAAWGLSAFLGTSPITYSPPERIAIGLLSLAAVTVSFLMLYGELALRLRRKRKLIRQKEERPPFFIKSSLDKLTAFSSRCIPAIVVLVFEGGKLTSIGLRSSSMIDGVIIGAVLGVGFMFLNGNSFSPSRFRWKHLESVYRNTITVTGEEFLIHGFLQIRMIAWLGLVPGWLITSFIFALFHYPQERYFNGRRGINALAYPLMTLPMGMMLGAVFYVSGNLLAPILLHLSANISRDFPRREARCEVSKEQL